MPTEGARCRTFSASSSTSTAARSCSTWSVPPELAPCCLLPLNQVHVETPQVTQFSTILYGPCILFLDGETCTAPADTHLAERRQVS